MPNIDSLMAPISRLYGGENPVYYTNSSPALASSQSGGGGGGVEEITDDDVTETYSSYHLSAPHEPPDTVDKSQYFLKSKSEGDRDAQQVDGGRATMSFFAL